MKRLAIAAIFILIAVPAYFLYQGYTERQARIARQEQEREWEKKGISREALDRRARSMALLKSEGVLVSDTLPATDDSKAAKTRRKEEIAQRAIALCIVAEKGRGLKQATVDALVKKFGAERFFSPKESAFVKNRKPSEEERSRFSWRAEDYWVLLWALGYVDQLGKPTGQCDIDWAAAVLQKQTAADFVKNAKLRPLSEILDEADLIYRYDWAAVEGGLHGQSSSRFNAEVIGERHYVLNWLTGYMDQAWDDISTDT